MEYTPIRSVTSVEQPCGRSGQGPRHPRPDHRRQRRDRGARGGREAAARARAGDGPTVIEAQTYRHYGHSRADPAKYRPADEVEEWMRRDPLVVARERLTRARRRRRARSTRPPTEPLAPCSTRSRRRRRRPRPTRPRPSPTSGRTEVRHGGTSRDPITYRDAVAEGIAREMRADPTRRVSRRGHRRRRGRLQDHGRAVQGVRGRRGSGTPRSRSRRSSGPPWGRP